MLRQIWLPLVVLLDLLSFASAATTTTCPPEDASKDAHKTFTCASATKSGAPWVCPTVLSVTAAVAPSQPTVFMIRHGEKDNANPVWDLNPTGQCRAMCIERLFGIEMRSKYNITKILVETPKCENGCGKHQRPALTAANLAHSLNITMDMSCEECDHECVAKVVHSYTNQGNILIVWEHHNLACIAQRLQVGTTATVSPYPEVFNQIWTATSPFTVRTASQEVCTEIVGDKSSPSCKQYPAQFCSENNECVLTFGSCSNSGARIEL